MKLKVKEISQTDAAADDNAKKEIKALVKAMDRLSTGDIVDDFLQPENFPEIPDPMTVNDNVDDDELPSRLKLRFNKLLDEIVALHPSFRITSNSR
jgi:CRISPR/Cas system CSM-associated protein Csm2 small subunit